VQDELLLTYETDAVSLQIPYDLPGENIFISASNGGCFLRANDKPFLMTRTQTPWYSPRQAFGGKDVQPHQRGKETNQ
jgi:hypothetical protein